MSKSLRPTSRPTLEELKRLGDKAMADAIEAIVASQQAVVESRKLRCKIDREG